MIQFLEFTFRSFWTFCGVFALASLAAAAFVSAASVMGTVLAAVFRK